MAQRRKTNPAVGQRAGPRDQKDQGDQKDQKVHGQQENDDVQQAPKTRTITKNKKKGKGVVRV